MTATKTMPQVPTDVVQRFEKAVRKYPVARCSTTGGVLATFEWCQEVQRVAGAVYRMGYYGPIDSRLEAATRRLIGGDIRPVVMSLASQPGRVLPLDEWGYAVRSWVVRQADQEAALGAVADMLVGVAAEILAVGDGLSCRGEVSYCFVTADGRLWDNRTWMGRPGGNLGYSAFTEPGAFGPNEPRQPMWPSAFFTQWMHPAEAERHAQYISQVTGIPVTPVVVGQSPRAEA